MSDQYFDPPSFARLPLSKKQSLLVFFGIIWHLNCSCQFSDASFAPHCASVRDLFPSLSQYFLSPLFQCRPLYVFVGVMSAPPSITF